MYRTKLLYNELVQLEINNNNGKVDHPDNCSKDQADAMCGATYTASSFAEEYAHDYGEDADITLKINNQTNDMRQQVTVSLEQELLKMREYLNPKNIDEGLDSDLDYGDMRALNNDIVFPM